MAEYDEPISDRELDVLTCLAEGASNREIAQQLSISPNTVKVHLRNIYTKLGVSSRTEATTVALQKGVLSIPGIEVEGSAEEEPPAEEEGDEEQEAETPAPEVEAVVETTSAPEPADVIQAGTAPRPGARSRRPLFLIALLALVALLLAAAAAGRVWLGPDPATSTPTAGGAVTPLPSAPPPAAEVELGGNWRQGVSFSPPRSGMALVSVGLNIYQIGGETEAGVLNSVLVYDTQARTWVPGRPKITPVADAAAAVLGGEIYVVGGRLENGQATAVVEAYSPLNDAWRPVVSLPRPVAGGVAIGDNNALYLFGGRRQGEAVADVYRFDPALQAWEALPPMSQARAFATGGLVDGQLHVVGGFDGQEALASCERFDTVSEEWDTCPAMQVPRQGAGAATVLDKLYVIGGATASAGGLGEIFDPESGWELLEEPADARLAPWRHLGVANVETRIYALGGLHQGERSGEMLIYAPQVYLFFIPAASGSGGE